MYPDDYEDYIFPSDNQVLAESDEFVITKDDQDFVHILDGEDTIRISIPVDIFYNLIAQVNIHTLANR